MSPDPVRDRIAEVYMAESRRIPEGQQPRRTAPSPEEMAEIARFRQEAMESGIIVATSGSLATAR